MKIESLNPTAGQPLDGRVGNAHQLLAGNARPATNYDSLNLSMSFPSAEKNLSALLSSLIEMLNKLEFHNVGSGLALAQDGQPQGLPLLESLFYKGEEPLAFLKEFIENSGLLYEAKIAKGDIQGAEDDLKGLLLRLTEKKGDQSETSKTARVLFNDIEARQLLNIKGKEEGVFYLQIPVLLPQGASTAEVYVSRDGKGKGEYMGDSHRIGFSIDLREAGVVSFDALVSKGMASIRVRAEKADFLEFMKAYIPELMERLSGYGMTASLERAGTNG